jgi:hypothetical protein
MDAIVCCESLFGTRGRGMGRRLAETVGLALEPDCATLRTGIRDTMVELYDARSGFAHGRSEQTSPDQIQDALRLALRVLLLVLMDAELLAAPDAAARADVVVRRDMD